MQSNKTSSRKPREATADVAGQVTEASAAGPAKTRKTAASSSPKKTVSKSAAPAKRHRTATTAVPVEQTTHVEQAAQAEIGNMMTAPKSMAAASGAGSGSFYSDAVNSVGSMTEPQAVGVSDTPASEKTGRTNAPSDEIARLAHSYWAERGYQHGSHEEDWLRAERELKSRR